MKLAERLKAKEKEISQRREARDRDLTRKRSMRAAAERIREVSKILAETRGKKKNEPDPVKRAALEAKEREITDYLENEKRNASGNKYRTAISKQP